MHTLYREHGGLDMSNGLDDFIEGQGAGRWQPLELGGGCVTRSADGLRLGLPALAGGRYADAQITDYAGLARRDFPWRPPLRLTVQAQASAAAEGLAGTAGFGLWNDPFLPGRGSLPRLPRAAWFFFGAPPNDMRLALDRPGHGWKAAVFDAQRPLFWALLPLALPGFLLMRIPSLYRVLWPVGQRALGVAEAGLPGVWLAELHEYGIEWRPDCVIFTVDGRVVLTTDRSPRGPLGFIAWIDNQYAVITPQGRLGWGIAPNPEEWLALGRVRIETPDTTPHYP